MKKFKINLLPFEAAEILSKKELIYDEHHEISGKQLSILVFQRYYFRTNSTTSLTVIIENTGGVTFVKCIAAGSSTGIFGFDLGSGKNFVKWVEEEMEPYRIE